MNIRIIFNMTFMQQFKELVRNKYFYLCISLLSFYNPLLYQIFHEIAETYLWWTQVVDHSIDKSDTLEI